MTIELKIETPLTNILKASYLTYVKGDNNPTDHELMEAVPLYRKYILESLKIRDLEKELFKKLHLWD